MANSSLTSPAAALGEASRFSEIRGRLAFLLGGMEKARILDTMRPHIYFDDQVSHLRSAAGDIPMVHIPFGIANKPVA